MRILTLTAETAAKNLALIERYGRLIEGVEVRLDFLNSTGEQSDESALRLLQAAKARNMTALLSCRRKEDGGGWEGSEEERVNLLARALYPGFDYLDLEEAPPLPESGRRRLTAQAADQGTRLIGSLHSFDGVPRGWTELLKRIARAGRIPKLACTPQNFASAVEVYRRSRSPEMPAEKILLMMGGFGAFSRFLYRRIGSLATFLSPPERKAVAWHPDPEQFTMLYAADRIDEETPLYGVVGHPVHHSRSPELHNHWLREAGLPGSYLPFQVDRMESFLSFAHEAGVEGFSVTLPHKRRVMELIDETSPEVERIGACNTVLRERGRWRGYNTDMHGFLAPLETELARGRLQRALVVGGGGAARTVAAALSSRGVDWVCVNRSPEKARELAEEAGGSWMPRERAGEAAPFDLIVQTTSAGMEPDVAEDPLPQYRFGGGELVYELIYAPEATRFLTRARQAGCATIGGVHMLQAQAREQFRLFTGGVTPPER